MIFTLNYPQIQYLINPGTVIQLKPQIYLRAKVMVYRTQVRSCSLELYVQIRFRNNFRLNL